MPPRVQTTFSSTRFRCPAASQKQSLKLNDPARTSDTAVSRSRALTLDPPPLAVGVAGDHRASLSHRVYLGPSAWRRIGRPRRGSGCEWCWWPSRRRRIGRGLQRTAIGPAGPRHARRHARAAQCAGHRNAAGDRNGTHADRRAVDGSRFPGRSISAQRRFPRPDRPTALRDFAAAGAGHPRA